MKQTHIAIICLALLTAMTSCQKENGTITLGVRIDNINGNQKLYINGFTPQWENGDPVWINGNGDYSVTVNNNTAQIANVARDNNNQYTAVYPADIVPEGQTGNNGTVTVNLPREQQYLSNGNHQHIKLPMIANYDGQDLLFKNLCSLVKVAVTNSTGSSISISRITLTASNAMLSGSTTASIITDENDNKHGQLGDWTSEAEHDVSLVFSTPESIEINGKDFYLSVPEFDNTELSIIIYTNDNRFLPVLKNSVHLSHNSIATVSVTISNQNQLLTTQEAFTVDGNNTKVRFSKGNLQYSRQGTHTTADNNNTGGTWRFAKHQYDTIGTGNNNISDDTYTGWIDLFGWGTSGYNYSPILYTTSNSSYYHKKNDIANSDYDWGKYNMIDNYPVNTWRTPTSSEWDYILNGRTTGTKYAEVKVNHINGLILFPDNFSWPSILTNPPITTYNSTHSTWNNADFSIAQWSILEAAGVIFLPAAGKRTGNVTADVNSTGYYWSSSKSSSASWNEDYAQSVLFNTSSVNNGHFHCNRYQGNSVRLVQDITTP